MVTISLQVSDELAERLAPYRDRLPEIVELGLSQVESGAREGAETNRGALKAQVLAALRSTGIITAPDTAHAGTRVRRTPVKAGGPPASELIIAERRERS
jgi:hypothetical protein